MSNRQGYLVNKQKIRYIHGDQAMLDQIKPLWEALNEHHRQNSPGFKEHYCQMTFEKRKAGLLKKVAGGKMRVDLGADEASGLNIGYCVCSLDSEKTGEIESIFVNPGYRGMGVGGSLMKKALLWMEQEGALAKTVRWLRQRGGF